MPLAATLSQWSANSFITFHNWINNVDNETPQVAQIMFVTYFGYFKRIFFLAFFLRGVSRNPW